MTVALDLSQLVTAADKAAAADAAYIASVKTEASRRILVILPEWKQRNLTAQAAILADKGRANWTAGELAAWNAGAALWLQIAAIRAASDVLEDADPRPADITDDTHWSEPE